MKEKKKSMSRDEATALYNELRKRMGDASGGAIKEPPAGKFGKADPKVAKQIASEISRALGGKEPVEKQAPRIAPAAVNPNYNAFKQLAHRAGNVDRGRQAALVMVLVFAALKVTISGLEASGFMSATIAQATLEQAPARVQIVNNGPAYSKEEIKLLTSLDSRRSELQAREKRLDEKAGDLSKRETEFAAKLTQLKDMTQRLQSEREKVDRKQDGQITQLANVYSSMNPEEAARLIEQLDITIAINLLSKMPEKRMGQVMALMSPERALTITKLLSGGGSK